MSSFFFHVLLSSRKSMSMGVCEFLKLFFRISANQKYQNENLILLEIEGYI